MNDHSSEYQPQRADNVEPSADTKISFSERLYRNLGNVMNQLGATPLSGLLQHPPFDWIKGRISEYRASQESRRILEEVLPVRLEDMGMKGVVQIPSSTGQYIVHLGQIHSSSDLAVDYFHPQIATSQKVIEQFLIKAGITDVFMEGTIEEDIEIVNDFLDRIRNIQLTKNFAENLPRIVDYITQSDNAAIYKYAFRRKIEDFLQISMEQGWEKEQAKAKRVLETLGIEDDLVDPYKQLGAVRMLMAQGKVKVHPAEEKEAHEKGSTLASRMIQIQNEMFEEMTQEELNEERILFLKEELVSAAEGFSAFDHSERENIAVRKIVNHPAFAEGKLHFLVYGAAHNFSNSVNEHNMQIPDNQCGLIYIADKDTFNKKE